MKGFQAWKCQGGIVIEKDSHKWNIKLLHLKQSQCTIVNDNCNFSISNMSSEETNASSNIDII
jgi:hypothetical protein